MAGHLDAPVGCYLWHFASDVCEAGAHEWHQRLGDVFCAPRDWLQDKYWSVQEPWKWTGAHSSCDRSVRRFSAFRDAVGHAPCGVEASATV